MLQEKLIIIIIFKNKKITVFSRRIFQCDLVNIPIDSLVCYYSFSWLAVN